MDVRVNKSWSPSSCALLQGSGRITSPSSIVTTERGLYEGYIRAAIGQLGLLTGAPNTCRDEFVIKSWMAAFALPRPRVGVLAWLASRTFAGAKGRGRVGQMPVAELYRR